MSDLEAILDEIKDGADVDDLIEMGKDKSESTEEEPEVSKEELDMSVSDKIVVRNSDEFKNLFPSLYNDMLIGRAVATESKVDKKIVLQVLEGKEGSNINLVKAKLTSAPSIMNKLALREIVEESEEKLKEGLSTSIPEIASQIEYFKSNKEKIIVELETQANNLASIGEQIKSKNSLLIDKESKESVDIFNYGILDVGSISYDCGYPKYENSALWDKVSSLANWLEKSEKINSNYENVGKQSISELYNYINVLHSSYVASVTFLTEVDMKVPEETDECTTDVYKTVEKVRECIDTYNSSQDLFGFKLESDATERLLDLVDFID